VKFAKRGQQEKLLLSLCKLHTIRRM